MAKLNRLIKGQDVAFDTHQAGDGQPTHWERLHLEKRLHGGRGKLKFPLFGGALPTKPKRMSQDDYFSILREVQKALDRNEQLLEDLAETIASQIDRFSNGEATVDSATEAADRIAGYFELDESFRKIVTRRMEKIVSISTLHRDKRDRLLYEVVQSGDEVLIQSARFWAEPEMKVSRRRVLRPN